MSTPIDPRTREREALEAAHATCPHNPEGICAALKRDCDNSCHHAPWSLLSTCAWIGHEMIERYGRAVREADKEAVRKAVAGRFGPGAMPSATDPVDAFNLGVQTGGECAAAAIEALEEKP